MEITIKNSISEINLVHKAFEEYARINLKDAENIQKICVVIDEVLSNIITYGYKSEINNSINFYCSINSGLLTLIFKDEGVSFNPLLVPNPDTITPLETRKEGSLGIHIMKNLMDETEYERRGSINILTLKKNVK